MYVRGRCQTTISIQRYECHNGESCALCGLENLLELRELIAHEATTYTVVAQWHTLGCVLSGERPWKRHSDKRWRRQPGYVSYLRRIGDYWAGLASGNDIVSCAVGALIYRSSGRPTRSTQTRPVSAAVDPIKTWWRYYVTNWGWHFSSAVTSWWHDRPILKRLRCGQWSLWCDHLITLLGSV